MSRAPMVSMPQMNATTRKPHMVLCCARKNAVWIALEQQTTPELMSSMLWRFSRSDCERICKSLAVKA